MKWFFVVLLAVGAPLVAMAGVEKLTFSNAGTAQPNPDGPEIFLTVGQPLTGRTVVANGPTEIRLGFWEYLGIYTGLSPADEGVPDLANTLDRNYPNPFNPSTRIRYSLAVDSLVQIDVFDLKGRKVDSLLHEEKAAGSYSLTYSPNHLASGTYIVLMRAGEFRATQRMMLLK